MENIYKKTIEDLVKENTELKVKLKDTQERLDYNVKILNEISNLIKKLINIGEI